VDQLALVGGRELRIRAVGDPEHLVAGAEARDVVADRHDPSGDIGSRDRMLGLGDPVAGKTDQVGGATDEVGDTSVDAGCVHLDQHLRRRELWPVDAAQLQHLGRDVSVLDHRTHRLTFAHCDNGCALCSGGGGTFQAGRVLQLVNLRYGHHIDRVRARRRSPDPLGWHHLLKDVAKKV
jgi:hypothetical protein